VTRILAERVKWAENKQVFDDLALHPRTHVTVLLSSHRFCADHGGRIAAATAQHYYGAELFINEVESA
jgi:hypothetical protein